MPALHAVCTQQRPRLAHVSHQPAVLRSRLGAAGSAAAARAGALSPRHSGRRGLRFAVRTVALSHIFSMNRKYIFYSYFVFVDKVVFKFFCLSIF